MRAKKPKKSQDQSRNKPARHNPRVPFIQHLYELRKRLFFVALSVLLWGTAAYFVQQQLVRLLLAPAHNQQFIYTSVGGGIDFLFRVCIYAGIALSIPVIVFQVLKYLQPLIQKDAVRFVAWGSAASAVLALGGMAFGYFIGLPAALHFLLHQFTTSQIHPLLTIQSYMSFVTMYMLGSALLFQLPLILVLVNRIRPLRPKKLLGYERWVILIAFIGGGIMNPSPRIQDQLLLAGPMILAYQVGVVLVWLINRHRSRNQWLTDLVQKDTEQQALRRNRFQQARMTLEQKRAALTPAAAPKLVAPVAPKPVIFAAAPQFHVQSQHQTTVAAAPAPQAQPARPASSRPTRYFNDFSMRRSAGQRYPRTTPDSPEATA